MRRIVFVLIITLCGLAKAAEIPADCEAKLLAYEKNTDSAEEAPYEKCGFKDTHIVWNRWAPLAAQKNAPKMLYEICYRFPDHLYHDIYCNKAYQTNYPPALAYKAKQLLLKNNLQEALKAAADALNAQQLSSEEEGDLLAAFGVYYVEKQDSQAGPYLETAAERRSALANHILGVLSYQNVQNADKDAKEAFQYIWRAILLGCPAAEENLGLLHLARQNKIGLETAKEKMRENMLSCAPTAENTQQDSAESAIHEDIFSCACGTVLKTEEKNLQKPYILKKTDGNQAVLEDKAGEVYTVSAGDNLPGQGIVKEIHKTAVVLVYNEERIILSLIKEDPCLEACHRYRITTDLSPEEMKQKILNHSVRIQPYHLTFTPGECEAIAYYAPALVDVNLPYVGKKECQNQKEPSVNLIRELESTRPSSTKPGSSESGDLKKQPDIEALKSRFKSVGDDLSAQKRK